jgi:hypothetical protein
MATPKQSQFPLNRKIVLWAQGRVGTRVYVTDKHGRRFGEGVCWDLGEEALKQNGAQTSNDLGLVGPDTNYVWGDPIALKDVEPGDVLQLRDHVVTTTTVTTYEFLDGSRQEETEERFAKRGHHTAIANRLMDQNDGAIGTLEQHVKPKGDVVQYLKINTRDVLPVVTKTSARHMNPTTKRVETAKVTQSVTITVKGSIWAYRPKPK